MTEAAALQSPAALPATDRSQLEYLPVGLFGSVMGLTGLSVAWRLAQARYGTPDWIAPALGVVAAATFIAMLGGYTAVGSTASWSPAVGRWHPRLCRA